MEKWKRQFIRSLYHYDSERIDIDGAYRLKDAHIPKSLFKYRSFSENHIDALEKGVLYMSHPQSFNDPFDTAVHYKVPFPPDNMTAAGFSEVSGRDLSSCEDAIIKMRTANNLGECIRAELAFSYPNKPQNELDLISKTLMLVTSNMEEGIAHSFNDKIKSSTLVLSLSEVSDDILMWSHYSDNHRGFVIEYDLSIYPPDYPLKWFCFPVFYSRKIRNFSRYLFGNGGRNNLFSSFASAIKLKQWSYEHEWRIIFAHGITENKTLQMPPPSRIILGAHTNEKDTSRMVEICSRSEIKLMQARLSLAHGKIVIEGLVS